MKQFFPVLVLWGCGGASPLTLIDELRVLDVVVDPASPAPGETPGIAALVVDPSSAGFETFQWWCQEEVCGEQPVVEGLFVEAFVLACAPGACDGPGDDLENPDTWMATLPLQGVSLAKRTVPVSPSAEDRLNDNPVVTPLLEELEPVATDSVTELVFQVSDEQAEQPFAFGFSTAGGFQSAEGRPVVEGAVTLEFVAPAEAGRVDLFVVVQDGLGGSANWSGVVLVE